MELCGFIIERKGKNMKTKIVAINANAIDFDKIKEAGDILIAGELVAFPTETVYGLGGNALSPEASRKIYAAKGRPSDNPLIVHITNMQDFEKIAMEVPQTAYQLAEAFWPGPLTMIVKKSKLVPFETTGGMNTVAIRMPSHPIAKQLIDMGGGFIAAPSANTSGRPSPTLAKHVQEDLEGKISMIIDGGEVGIGIESTIVDLSEGIPTILRPGYITKEMMQKVIGTVQIDPGIISSDSLQKPKAPGMKYKHYAPKANLVIVDGMEQNVIDKINILVKKDIEKGKKVGIIGTDESVSFYNEGIILSIGVRKKEDTIAQHLYAILREFDDMDVEMIYSESFATPRIGSAIMNRLLKAAGHQIIHV